MQIKTYEQACAFLKKHNLGHQEWDAFGERLEGMFNQNIWVEAAYVNKGKEDTVEVVLRERGDEEPTIISDEHSGRVELSDFAWNEVESFRVKIEVFQLFIVQLVMGFDAP